MRDGVENEPARRHRAVVFDLWETLIDWDPEGAARMVAQVGAVAGDGFVERWNSSTTRYVAPLRMALAEAGVGEGLMDEICAIRLAYHRKALVPRPGAVDTLRELKRLGFLVGLITVCSEDIVRLWPESDFAGLFDAEVFSSQVGLSKPDPRIYLHCCELLDVEPHEAVFVGDGANDELAGARRVGMEAILIEREGEDPLWPEIADWAGPRVTTIPGVLSVLERL
ncbi:MAG: HAD-IA family hydrolase [Actinobacteria bacterium]|nr:HAD-IA family hydrolase [Actinomycetota bacterium]